MPKLEIGGQYSREDVHDIFSPDTAFTPRAGTWGILGIVPVPPGTGDYVFFVTFGQSQGEHVFDESITEDGVLTWQSQPAQRLADAEIKSFIAHDDRINSIHLFLRTKARAPYTYFGRLGYRNHDATREKPVYFQWQLLEWPPEAGILVQAGLKLEKVKQESSFKSETPKDTISIVDIPHPPARRGGVSTMEFRKNKTPDYAVQDEKNRDLGLRGELLVVAWEKARLIAEGRSDLAAQVVHVSVEEGDFAGYDIRSFSEDGAPRYLEVKTTKGVATTNFFLSANELAFSVKNPGSYELFRLFDFVVERNSARAFVLKGSLEAQLSLKPTAYRADVCATTEK